MQVYLNDLQVLPSLFGLNGAAVGVMFLVDNYLIYKIILSQSQVPRPQPFSCWSFLRHKIVKNLQVDLTIMFDYSERQRVRGCPFLSGS